MQPQESKSWGKPSLGSLGGALVEKGKRFAPAQLGDAQKEPGGMFWGALDSLPKGCVAWFGVLRGRAFA